MSLFNSPGRLEDVKVDAEAVHKAGKQLCPGGALVKDSFLEKKLDFDWGPGGRIEFTLSGGPPLIETAVLELAGMQIQALFSLLTTEDPRVLEKTIVLPRDRLAIFGYYSASDWGNPLLAELTRRTLEWECPLLVTAAKGYFRVVLRRCGRPEDGWFWALEWNRFVRIVGGIFDKASPPAWLDNLPALKGQELPNGWIHRREVRLAPSEDRLFSFPEMVT
jgi:hypothetical protein